MVDLTIQWNATANIYVKWKSFVVHFDPWFRRNPFANPKLKGSLEDIDENAIIFLSHGHFDHLQDIPDILVKKENVIVHCSQVAKKTIEGQLYKNLVLKKEAISTIMERVIAINSGDTYTFKDKKLNVDVIKSEHIKFDAKSVLRVLFSLDAWKQVGNLIHVAREYPKGDVFGYDVHFGDEGRLVMFGSLCKKYPEILKQHANPDVLLVPCAGRFNSDAIACEIARIIKPKLVIPIHHDDFYPPLSYRCPIDKLKEIAQIDEIPTKFLELQPETEIKLSL